MPDVSNSTDPPGAHAGRRATISGTTGAGRSAPPRSPEYAKSFVVGGKIARALIRLADTLQQRTVQSGRTATIA